MNTAQGWIGVDGEFKGENHGTKWKVPLFTRKATT